MGAYRQLPPNEREANVARISKRLLSQYAQEHQPLTLHIIDADHAEPIELPAGVVALLVELLGAMASGQGIILVPENAELTTVQAADILNVSRPHLIKLLEDNRLPYRKVGKHRRIRMEDVMNYKRVSTEERERILDQLVADAQAQSMGYE